jgi:hypothetical protein
MTKRATAAKEGIFWIAVGLAGVVGVWLVKIAAARLPLPQGAKDAAAAL